MEKPVIPKEVPPIQRPPEITPTPPQQPLPASPPEVTPKKDPMPPLPPDVPKQ